MSKAGERLSASSVFARSFFIYFEPVVNFFKTKYLNELQGNVQSNGEARGQPQVRAASPGVVSEFAEGMSFGGVPFSFSGMREKTIRPETSIDRVELELADIWKRVLGVNAVSRQDNFFDLGGYSVLLVSLYQEVQARFQVAPPIRYFSVAKNLSEMALLIFYQQVFAPIVVADDNADLSWAEDQPKKSVIKQEAE